MKAPDTHREDPELHPAEEEFLRAIRRRLEDRRLHPPPSRVQEKAARAVLTDETLILSPREAGEVLKILHRDQHRQLWADSEASRSEAEEEYRKMLQGEDPDAG